MNKPIRVITLGETMSDLADSIYLKTNGIVQDGPFKGMQIYPDSSWGERNIVSELLGFFEQELHGPIETQIVRLSKMDNPVVVNVGCAEGYYAVGMGRRLPKAAIYAFDIDTRSMQIAQKNAAVNGVTLTNGSIEEAFAKADLILMDCEGAETDYLKPDIHPRLREATIIVELHQKKDASDIVEFLHDRFVNTHNAIALSEEGRNPNASPLMWGYHSFDRWLAVNENRPCRMAWAILTPYIKTVRECGGCTLCCTHERVEALKKPKGAPCQYCEGGCAIYAERPRVCRAFNCLWLTDPDMPEHLRPNLIGAYAYGEQGDGVLKISAESERRELIDYVTKDLGLHAIINRGQTIEFVTAEGREMPPAIKLDWTLR